MVSGFVLKATGKLSSPKAAPKKRAGTKAGPKEPSPDYSWGLSVKEQAEIILDIQQQILALGWGEPTRKSNTAPDGGREFAPRDTPRASLSSSFFNGTASSHDSSYHTGNEASKSALRADASAENSPSGSEDFDDGGKKPGQMLQVDSNAGTPVPSSDDDEEEQKKKGVSVRPGKGD